MTTMTQSLVLKLRNNPHTDYLLDNWAKIRDEYVELRRVHQGIENCLEANPHDTATKPQVTTLHARQPIYQGLIHAAPLMCRPESASLADKIKIPIWHNYNEPIFLPKLYELMPTIGHWAKANEEHLGSVVFYLNQPGSRINHHYGPETNHTNLRLHLGLSTDPDAEFDLENQRYTWRDGELIAFDDSNVYHAVRHRGSRPRLILAFDYNKSLLEPYIANELYEPRVFQAKHTRVPPQIDPEWLT